MQWEWRYITHSVVFAQTQPNSATRIAQWQQRGQRGRRASHRVALRQQGGPKGLLLQRTHHRNKGPRVLPFSMLHRRQTPKACRCKVFQHLQALIAAAAGFVAGAGNAALGRTSSLQSGGAATAPARVLLGTPASNPRAGRAGRRSFQEHSLTGLLARTGWAVPCSPAPMICVASFPAKPSCTDVLLVLAQAVACHEYDRLIDFIRPAFPGRGDRSATPMLEDLGRARARENRPLCLPCTQKRGTPPTARTP